MARGVTLAGVTPGLRRLAWLIEVRGLANRSEGLTNRSERLVAGLAWALSIKVTGIGGRTGLGPVDKSEGLGRAGSAKGLSIKVKGCEGPGWPRACR